MPYAAFPGRSPILPPLVELLATMKWLVGSQGKQSEIPMEEATALGDPTYYFYNLNAYSLMWIIFWGPMLMLCSMWFIFRGSIFMF